MQRVKVIVIAPDDWINIKILSGINIKIPVWINIKIRGQNGCGDPRLGESIWTHYTSASTKLKGGGVYWYHLVRLSVCGQNHVRSVSSTILIGSISYLTWDPIWLNGMGNHEAADLFVNKLTTIGSDNGLLPDQCKAIIWTNAGILLIGPWRTNFSEILVEILTFSFKKMCLKISSAKWQPFCLSLNVLRLDDKYMSVNWITIKWNLILNSKVFIQENVIESVVCKMMGILSEIQYVNCNRKKT